ncbi:MAG: ATP-dependent DNA helicase [Eubacteriales bacterium]|nr:ATP-dependent DNA helicase [Eubacteriales bacterium]
MPDKATYSIALQAMTSIGDNDTSVNSGLPVGGIWSIRAGIYVRNAIYDPRCRERSHGLYAARYSEFPNSLVKGIAMTVRAKTDEKSKTKKQKRFGDGTTVQKDEIFLLHTILSPNKRRSFMFKITKYNQEALEYYRNERMAYPDAEYDFTFENRYVIYHCALRHQIVYIAIDMKTGLSSEICSRRAGTFFEHEYKKLIPKILYSIKYTGDKRYLNAVAQNPLEVIESIFRVILPEYGFSVREEQIKLCKQMYIGLTEKQAAICEAEVGTGKSMAYLVAAVCARMNHQTLYRYATPVTITTSNIELQNALIEKEIPLLSKILLEYHIINRPLKAVLRKGKEHYFCPFRLEDYLKSIRKYPEKYGSQISRLAEMKSSGKVFDLDKVKIPGYLKSRICVKGQCGKCEFSDVCRYSNFISHALNENEDLDFQVTNHNLYLMSSKQAHILRPSEMVIIDEAHKLKEAAQTVFGEMISEKDVARYVRWIKTLCKPREDTIAFHELREKIAGKNNELFSGLRAMVHADDAEDSEAGTIIALTDKQISLITQLASDIESIDSMLQAEKGRCEINGLRISKALLRFGEPSKISVWVDIDENNEASLCCCPKNIGKKLMNKIWDSNCSHVLTSGTMSDGANFDFFKRENGLDRIPKHGILESSTPSPFDYTNHTRLYIPDDMPYPDNNDETYINAVADRVVQLVKAAHGHTAILFTSYKVLHAVYQLTERNLKNYDVICMTRSNKTAISDFKKSKNGVLFASGSMWEGVDCIGDCLSSVIIVRLPFPLRTATMEEKKNACQNIPAFIRDYAVPEMLIKLRQGAGRLIRCEKDTGLLSILDSRASENGSYRSRVLTALGQYPLIGSTEEIASFFKAVKPEEYFER